MTLLERIRKADQRKLPSNVVPMTAKPQRRAVPRWMEWTREYQNDPAASQDLTGYLRDVA